MIISSPVNPDKILIVIIMINHWSSLVLGSQSANLSWIPIAELCPHHHNQGISIKLKEMAVRMGELILVVQNIQTIWLDLFGFAFVRIFVCLFSQRILPAGCFCARRQSISHCCIQGGVNIKPFVEIILIFWTWSMLRVAIVLAFLPQFKENDDWWGCGWILIQRMFSPPPALYIISTSLVSFSRFRISKETKAAKTLATVRFCSIHHNLPHNCHYNNCNEGVNFYCCPVITIAFIPHGQSYCRLPSPLSSYNIINIAIAMHLFPR